jgi:hypothetical protein
VHYAFHLLMNAMDSNNLTASEELHIKNLFLHCKVSKGVEHFPTLKEISDATVALLSCLSSAAHFADSFSL